MPSIIQSIHEQALDESGDIGDLVARAVFVSSVLRGKPVSAWLKRERDGYEPDDAVPAYRHGDLATLLAWRPGLGWVEAPITDAVNDAVSAFDLREEVAAIARKYAEIRKAGGHRLELSEERQAELKVLTNLDTRLSLAVPAEAYTRILDTVRSAIAVWSEELVNAGVEGQGSSFSDEEREAASQVAERLDDLLAEARRREAEAKEKSTRGGFFSKLLGKG